MDVTVILPTKNEEKNIASLISQLPYKVIVVDDSDDNTSQVAERLGAIVIRGQRKGLGQAIIDGIQSAKTEVVVVMDADLSHSPQEVPILVNPILKQGYDLVIGSRYISGGNSQKWSLKRRLQSVIGAKLMSLVTGVKDSNSGFFSFRKEIIEDVKLEPRSWKIMLEVLFKGKWIAKKEVPITFTDRLYGQSKNSNKERIKHAEHLLHLLIFKYKKFIQFALVGGVGNFWHYGLLYLLTEYFGLWYGLSFVLAVIVAMTSNYILNHLWTFNKEKKSNHNLFWGWLKFAQQALLVDYGVSLPVTIFLTEICGFHYIISSVLSSGVSVLVKFTLAKRFIWHQKKTARDADYEWKAYFQGLPWQKRWKRIIASIVKEFAGEAGKVLDCGCGSSPLGLMVNHADYIAYDTNNAKIRYMNSKRIENCSFITGGFDNIKVCVLSESMDTVLFVEVIEHLDNREQARYALDVFHSKLKNGGKLIVATPNFGGFMGRWMDRLYGVFQKGAYKEEHRLKFSLQSLKEICSEAGFTYIESRIPSGADMVCLFRKEKDAQIS